MSTIVLATVVSPSSLYGLDRVWGLAIIALSLIPVIGYAGRLSLCQMTFAAIGAIVVSHLGADGNPLSLLAAAGVCAVVGVLIALPALRLSGIYFALSTAAFAVAMDVWIFPLPAFDLFGHPFAPFGSGSLTFAPFRVGSWSLSSQAGFFVASSVLFAGLCFLVVAVRRSEFGHRLLAFKDSPAACATLGMNARISTLAVFALSAALAGVGGGVYGAGLGSSAADVYQFFNGLSVLLVVVVMGLSSMGAAAACGIFLGGPTLANLFPSLSQLSAMLVGSGGISVGTSPNGTIPTLLRPMWGSLTRRRWLMVALIGSLVATWGLRLGHVINNWTFAGIIFALVFLLPQGAYFVDYLHGVAPPLPGLPMRRSGQPSEDAMSGRGSAVTVSATSVVTVGSQDHGS
jgi:branched-chain amino acid transport system permease protein